MTKNKYGGKRNVKKRNVLAATLLLVAVLAGIAVAWPVPPPPPPPPVGQHVGINDTSVDQLVTTATDQGACRLCHTTGGTLINVVNGSTYSNTTVGGVPNRHHSLVQSQTTNPETGSPFLCQDCHPSTPGVGNGVLLDRNCLDCHRGLDFNTSGARVGNFSRPHHVNTTYDNAGIGNPAAARQCSFCHGGLVNDYNDNHYVPSYSSNFLDNMVSPLASFEVTSNVPNSPTVAALNPNEANKTWGGCYSCHLADNASGLPFNIEDNENNHHVSIMGFGTGFSALDTPIDLTQAPFGRICFMCHVVNTSSGSLLRVNITNTFATPPELLVKAVELRNSTAAQNTVSENGAAANITVNGTGCEKCHAPPSLHNIQFQYQQNGPAGLGHVNNNLDCNGCHESWTSLGTIMTGAIVPIVDKISPAGLVAGTATTLTITGSEFVNDQFTSVVKVDGVTYTPTSVTNTEIVVDIPALSAGAHLLQLVKGEDTTSKLSTLTVVPATSITSAKLGTGRDKGSIIITGIGFGAQPSSAQYVSVNHGGNQIVSTNIVSWSDTQIKVKNSAAAVGDVVTVLTVNSGEAQTPISAQGRTTK